MQAGYGVTFISRGRRVRSRGRDAGRSARGGLDASGRSRSCARPGAWRAAPRRRSSRSLGSAWRDLVRWGLDELGAARLAELDMERPFSWRARAEGGRRWSALACAARWSETVATRRRRARTASTASRRSAAVARSTRGRRLSGAAGSAARRRADDLLGRGVDAVLRRAAIPDKRKGGGGSGGPAGIVYDPSSRSGCPRRASGTAMNALAHCAEALYVRATSAGAPRRGADRLALPLVPEPGRHLRHARGCSKERCAPREALGARL